VPDSPRRSCHVWASRSCGPSRRERGPGLGIFIIRGIVAAHGGLLELENSRGGGAVLRILLPPAATG
jgi:Signal transduction histidine kinase involved in nitrogen fixation and metabolism regulation